MAVSQEKIFVLAAELGSLTEAAKILGCTQSNASHAITALEKEYGFPLLRRSRQGARLTKEGEQILPWVRAACRTREELNAKVTELQGVGNATLRVGSFTSVAVHWLPGIIKEFQSRYPGISFELLNGDYQDVDNWLIRGAVDAAFTRLPSSLSCSFLSLYEDQLMAILPADHPKASRPYFPIQDVQGESFISLLEGSDHDSIRTIREAGYDPEIRFTTKDDYALIAMVEEGLGISIVPELLLRGRTGNIVALPLRPACYRTIALAIPSENGKSPAVKQFASCVQEWVKCNRPDAECLSPEKATE